MCLTVNLCYEAILSSPLRSETNYFQWPVQRFRAAIGAAMTPLCPKLNLVEFFGAAAQATAQIALCLKGPIDIFSATSLCF